MYEGIAKINVPVDLQQTIEKRDNDIVKKAEMEAELAELQQAVARINDDIAKRAEKIDSLSELQRTAKIFVVSGFFGDISDSAKDSAIAKACVKIMAGNEMGLKPFQSMSMLHVIRGKICMSADLMALIISQKGYKTTMEFVKDDAGNVVSCGIVFYKNNEVVGVSDFSVTDAKAAGIYSDMYKKYIRNMLRSRAMSNGCRWFCIDAFGQSVYVPEEMQETSSTTSSTRSPLQNRFTERLYSRQSVYTPDEDMVIIDREVEDEK